MLTEGSDVLDLCQPDRQHVLGQAYVLRHGQSPGQEVRSRACRFLAHACLDETGDGAHEHAVRPRRAQHRQRRGLIEQQWVVAQSEPVRESRSRQAQMEVPDRVVLGRRSSKLVVHQSQGVGGLVGAHQSQQHLLQDVVALATGSVCGVVDAVPQVENARVSRAPRSDSAPAT